MFNIGQYMSCNIDNRGEYMGIFSQYDGNCRRSPNYCTHYNKSRDKILFHHTVPRGRCQISPFIVQPAQGPQTYCITRVIKNYLQWQEEQGVLQQVVWPPLSPDLRIKEFVWDHMDGQDSLNPQKDDGCQPTCRVPWKTVPSGVRVVDRHCYKGKRGHTICF